MSGTLLKIERLTKRFGGVVALDQVSFEVSAGRIASLIGPNGAGKTTLFNCVSGVLRPEEGRIQLVGKSVPGTEGDRRHDLHHLAPHEVACAGIARTFQNIRLFGQMTVLENVLVGTHVRTHAGILEAIWPWERRTRQEDLWALDRATRLLERLDLMSVAGRPAQALS